MSGEKRGQLDALLDVELLLPGVDATTEVAPPGTVPRAPGDSELAVGMQLGKYHLHALLGSGGMGTVWDARDTDLDRRIALKVMRPMADGVARARLIREARAMARLRDANVITVFDALALDGHDVIAMERIDGETLASWLSRQHPTGAIVATMLAAGRGLAAAHAAGLIHRDFKPHNVLVERGGRVVVTDFGLARASDELVSGDPVATIGALDSPLTITGAMLGTPAYMAPEQLSGQPADARADQFAFCATMWEAFTGQRPFFGDSVAAIAAVVAIGKPGAAELVPRRLRAVLERGMANDPDDRWPTMQLLLAAITRAWRRPRRLAIAAGAVALIALAIFVGHRALAHDVAPWRPEIVDLPAFEENGDGAVISPDGTQLAYISDREQTNVFRVYLEPLMGGESRAITPADNFAQPRWTRDGKALLLVHWRGPSFRIVRQPIDGGPFVDLGPGIGADDCGDAIAIAEAGGAPRLVLQHPDGSRFELARSTTENIMQPRCDAAGQRVTFMRGQQPMHDPIDEIIVVDRYGHEMSLMTGRSSSGPVFTPNGHSIVYSGISGGKVLLYEQLETGGRSHQITTENGPQLNADVSPDGRILVYDRDEAAAVAVAGGGGPPHNLTARREMLLSVAATRDGATLVSERLVEQHNELVVIAGGIERTLGYGMDPFLSRDDRRVYFHSVDPPYRLLAMPIEGGPVTTIATLPAKFLIGTDGPDGQHLELSRDDGTLEAWRVAPDGTVAPEDGALVIPAPTGGWRAIAFGKTGVHFRFVAPDGTASPHEITADNRRPTWLDDHRFAYYAGEAFHVIDVTTGAELAKMPGPEIGRFAVMAADGVHWFGIALVGHVTRHLIVNFADRPW